MNGQWSEWSEWTNCTCPQGQQIRKRECNNPEPSGGGLDCEEYGEDIKECGCNTIYSGL